MSESHPPDTEALLEALLAKDALEETDDGAIRLTTAFEDTLDLYEQSYGDLDDDRFVGAVADAFDVSTEEARRRVEDGEVTREEFVAYLALGAHFEEHDHDSPTAVERAVMASLVTEVSPATPVPLELSDVTADPTAFLDGVERALVFVWKKQCDPCREMKRDLEETLSALPAELPVAGVDGEAAPAFCERFDVTAAPAVVCIRGGELVRVETGYRSPEAIGSLVEEAFE